MTDLVRSELLRLRSRRMVRWGVPLVALMVGGVVAAIGVAVDTTSGTAPGFVDDMLYGASALNPRARVRILEPFVWLMVLGSFAVGASSFGSDQRQGVIEHLLTWEPRRRRLLAARAIACSIVAAALTAFFAATVIAGGYLLSLIWQTAGRLDWPTTLSVVLTVLRAAALGGLFGVMGLAGAVTLRSSVIPIVLAAVYMLQAEALVGVLVWQAETWLPLLNARAFVAGVGVSATSFGEAQELYDHSFPVVVATLVAYAAISLLVASELFSQRDAV